MRTQDLLRSLSELAESEPHSRRPCRFPLVHEELEARELLSVGQGIVAEPATAPLVVGATAVPAVNAPAAFDAPEGSITVQSNGTGQVQFLQSALPVSDMLFNLSLATSSVYATPGPITLSSGLLSLPITPLIQPLVSTTETPLHNGTILTGTVWITPPPLTTSHFQLSTLFAPPVSNSMLQVPSQEQIPLLERFNGEGGPAPSSGVLDAPIRQYGPHTPWTVDQLVPHQPEVSMPRGVGQGPAAPLPAQPTVGPPTMELPAPSHGPPSVQPSAPVTQPRAQPLNRGNAPAQPGVAPAQPGAESAQPGAAPGQPNAATGSQPGAAGAPAAAPGQQGGTGTGAGAQQQGGQSQPQNPTPAQPQQGQGTGPGQNGGSANGPSAYLDHATRDLAPLPIAADQELIDLALDDLDDSQLARPTDEPDSAVPTLLGAALVATGGYHLTLRGPNRRKRDWVAGPAGPQS